MCRQVARLRAKHLLLFHVMSLISFLLFFVILRRKLWGGIYFNVEKIKRCVSLLHKGPLQFTLKALREISKAPKINDLGALGNHGDSKIKLRLNDSNIVNNIIKEDSPRFLPLNSSLTHPTKLQEQPACLSPAAGQLASTSSLPPSSS